MKSASKFFSSLLITVAMSFLAPMMVCGLMLTLCAAFSIFPGTTAEMLVGGFTDFLKVFGSGSAWEGVLAMAIACSFVGGIFEMFNFYYYQNMN